MELKKNNSGEPFFIVGCERSGTTLLQVLTNIHPNIEVLFETFIFNRFLKFLPVYGDLKEDLNLNCFVNDLLQDVYISRLKLNISVSEFCEHVGCRSFAGCIDLLFTLYARHKGKRRWGEKTPIHISYIQDIITLFPEAKIIHVVRDGRDVAQSYLNVWFGPTTLYGIAKRWRNHILAFEKDRQHVKSENILELFYEQLVRHPQATMERVFQFLGEEPININHKTTVRNPHLSECQLTFHSNTHGMLNQIISDKRVGIYREILTRREIDIFEMVAGNQLMDKGYTLESSGDVPIILWERTLFVIQAGYRRLPRFYHTFVSSPFHRKAQLQLIRRRWLLRLNKRKHSCEKYQTREDATEKYFSIH